MSELPRSSTGKLMLTGFVCCRRQIPGPYCLRQHLLPPRFSFTHLVCAIDEHVRDRGVAVRERHRSEYHQSVLHGSSVHCSNGAAVKGV